MCPGTWLVPPLVLYPVGFTSLFEGAAVSGRVLACQLQGPLPQELHRGKGTRRKATRFTLRARQQTPLAGLCPLLSLLTQRTSSVLLRTRRKGNAWL